MKRFILKYGKFVEVMIYALALLTVIFFGGCTTFDVDLEKGRIKYSSIWRRYSAEIAEIYIADPNGQPIFWLVISDPNSRVNPGSFQLKEPYHRIGLDLKSK